MLFQYVRLALMVYCVGALAESVFMAHVTQGQETAFVPVDGKDLPVTKVSLLPSAILLINLDILMQDIHGENRG